MKALVILTSLWLVLSAGCINVKFPTPTLRPVTTPTAVATVSAATDEATDTVTEAAPDVTVTAAPMTTAAATDTATEAVSDALSGDAAEGDRLFHSFQPAAGMACMTCHRTDSDDRLVGPGLKSVAIRARTRVPGLSASQYIHTSIVNPSAYIVDGYPDLMPKNWSTAFTEAQLDDLVAYLFSLSR